MDATSKSGTSPHAAGFRVGAWTVEPASGTLRRGSETRTIEPKVMALLVYLSVRPGEVLSRASIDAALWADRTVGDDVLSRTVSKLRKALDDSAAAPAYIETLSKRGYRLIATVETLSAHDVTAQGAGGASHASEPVDPSTASLPTKRRRVRLFGGVSAVLLVAGVGVGVGIGVWRLSSVDPGQPVDARGLKTSADRLNARADEFYMRFTRADNEAAIVLYNRAIAADPDNPVARAGMANALVQRVVRWSTPPGSPPAATSMTEALRQGSMQGADQRATLDRAARMAEQAVRLAPRDPDALKALGFAYAASGEIDAAIRIYEDAVEIDPDAWTVWINLGEMQNLQKLGQGLESFRQAYEAMERRYAVDPQFIGPLRASMGLIVADTLEMRGQRMEAERWYRRILDHTPFEPDATARLARFSLEDGDRAGARQLCSALEARIGVTPGCEAVLQRLDAEETGR